MSRAALTLSATAIVLLPACVLFVDFDPFTSGGTRPTTTAGDDASSSGTVDASSIAEAGVDGSTSRFCDLHAAATICEDFDRGESNPALTYKPDIGPDNGEMRIVTDTSVSPPGSLFVSIMKNHDPNIQEYLVLTSPHTGTKVTFDMSYKYTGQDFAFFLAIDCASTRAQGFDGVNLKMQPDGTITIAHTYSQDETRLGKMPPDTFTPINVTMTIGPSSITVSANVGTAPDVAFDWPVVCTPNGFRRARLGLEGAGGRVAAGFDNVVYDVSP